MIRLCLLFLLLSSSFCAVLSTYLPLPLPHPANGTTEEVWLYFMQNIQGTYHLFFESTRTDILITSSGIQLIATKLDLTTAATSLTNYAAAVPKVGRWMHLAQTIVINSTHADIYLFINGFKVQMLPVISMASFSVRLRDYIYLVCC